MPSFDLVEPHSFEDAFDLLGAEGEVVRPLGGGTALMLMMKAQLFKPDRLVGLRHLDQALKGVALDPALPLVRIGARTTFEELERAPEIVAHFPVIGTTMKTLANVRVRSVATIGGNLAHGDPHLDLPPVWTALAADVVIRGPAGERTVPVEEIFAGYYETTVAQDELIVELRVPIRPGWRTSYTKVTTRSAHDWPALGIALSVASKGRVVEDIRLVLSAAVDRQLRLRAAEDLLRGTEIDDRLLDDVGAAAVRDADIGSDSRGSARYKQHLLRVYLRRALEAIIGDA